MKFNGNNLLRINDCCCCCRRSLCKETKAKYSQGANIGARVFACVRACVHTFSVRLHDMNVNCAAGWCHSYRQHTLTVSFLYLFAICYNIDEKLLWFHYYECTCACIAICGKIFNEIFPLAVEKMSIQARRKQEIGKETDHRWEKGRESMTLKEK